MHNLFVEKLVIGGILIDSSLMDKAQSLSSADFFGEEHQQIFSTMTKLWLDNNVIDIGTVQDRGKIQVQDILDTVRSTPSTLQFDKWVQIVKDYSNRRGLVDKLKDITSEIESTNKPVKHIMEDLQYEEESENGFKAAVKDVASDIFRKKKNPIRIGYRSVDSIIDLSPGDLMLVAARPSVGKTAFILNVMRRSKQPFLLFSIEMSKEKIIERLIAQEARINGQSVTRHTMSEDEGVRASKAISKIYEMPIEVIDNEYNINGIVARSIAWSKRNKGIVAIDYLQYIRGDNSRKREQEIADISRKSKKLAKRIGMPVVVLAQLNRELEKRVDHRPLLSDLRESGSLEQDADIVSFLYRGAIYEETEENSGVAELIIAKNRNGPTGLAKLAWIKEYGCFEELESED